MSNTPNRNFPYPTLFAAPDVPADIAALAIAIDSDIAAREALTKPGTLLARMTRAATANVASGAVIPWDAAPYNPNASWSAGAPSRFTATVAGWHHIHGRAHHGPIGTGQAIAAGVKVNGTIIANPYGAANGSPSAGTSIPFDEYALLAVGGFVEITIANSNNAATTANGSVCLITYAGP